MRLVILSFGFLKRFVTFAFHLVLMAVASYICHGGGIVADTAHFLPEFSSGGRRFNGHYISGNLIMLTHE